MAASKNSKILAVKVDPALDDLLTCTAVERGLSKAALIRTTLIDARRSAGRQDQGGDYAVRKV